IPGNPMFEVYPNPSFGWIRLQLENSDSVVNLQLYNQLGQLVREWPNAHSKSLIETSNLSAGAYYLHAIQEDGKSLGVLSIHLR
ncbi:MAG: T9SS type A sorting domain-containing protein, partial [Bacteroidota bacterium]